MLVWNAMPSIVPMMSPMRRELPLISSIVETTCDTTEPPRCATSAAELASWLAVAAESAVCLTVPVSCIIDAAASCRLDAVCSVREDRSMLPVAISALATLMLSVDRRTLRTRFCKAPCMLASEWSRRPVSSWLCTSMRLLKSNRAMASATSTA